MEDDGGFNFLHQLDEPLPDPWTPAAVAVKGRVPTTTGRLPFFAGLRSAGTGASTTGEDPSTGLPASGDGGMLYLLLPGGGGVGSGGCTDGDYRTVVRDVKLITGLAVPQAVCGAVLPVS